MLGSLSKLRIYYTVLIDMIMPINNRLALGYEARTWLSLTLRPPKNNSAVRRRPFLRASGCL